MHDLFTITGRSDAPGCNMAQPDFSQMEKLGNLITRIPTPVFGAGLIENIPKDTSMPIWRQTRRSSRAWELQAIPM